MTMHLMISLLLLAVSVAAADDSCEFLSYIDPFIGSSGFGYGYGSVAPAAQVPYGALRLGPDTASSVADISFRHFSGYNYNDKYIRAFSHTRLVGAGVDDLGTIGVMPVRAASTQLFSNLTNHPMRWWSDFDKTSEVAAPGTYFIHLPTPRVTASFVAAGTHTAMHQYTYEASIGDEVSGLVIDMCHAAAIDIKDSTCREASLNVDLEKNIISGSVLIAGSLSRRGTEGGIWVHFVTSIAVSGGRVVGYSTCSNADGQLACSSDINTAASSNGQLFTLLQLQPDTPDASMVVEMPVGISFISVEQASVNMQDSISTADSFSALQERVRSQWCDNLRHISFDSSDKTLLTILYTAAYRTAMSPTIYSEVGGVYLGMDNIVHNVTSDRCASYYTENKEKDLSYEYFSDFSLWDTFRTQHPWLYLSQPQVALGVLRSLSEMTEQSGSFPRWVLGNVETGCMIGMHGGAVVLEGILKGYGDAFDADIIQEAMLRQATEHVDTLGRTDLDHYLSEGFVSLEAADNAASLTLTYAFDDYCLAGISEFVGDLDAAIAAKQRSFNYRNVWSHARKFMCPRSVNGSFECPLDPTGPKSWGYYTEGDSLHWTYFVPHDPTGLIRLFGGEEVFQERLEEFFTESIPYDNKYGSALPNPYYWAGNEVDIHSVWFFNLVDCTRSQYWNRRVLQEHFAAAPNGLPGNDDYATMSAHILFCSLGLYPQVGTDKYYLGGPIVDNASVVLSDIATLNIVAYNNVPENPYVAKLLVNGKEKTTPYITHAELTEGEGATLEFFMSSSPASGLCAV